MNTKIKIGYQGTKYSYSEFAASWLAEHSGFEDYELLPLTSSSEVAKQLRTHQVQLGVVALQNTLGGIVKETYDAFISDEWIVKYRYILKIEHCLFVKNSNISADQIKIIASHPQALKQCKKSLTQLVGNYQTLKVEDTALSAKKMSENILPTESAIICSREAGLHYKLHLLAENIQDQENNQTEFMLVEKRFATTNFFQKMYFSFQKYLFNDKIYNQALKLAASLTILFSFVILKINKLIFPAEFSISLSQSMILSATISLGITAYFGRYRRKKELEMITGYWIYMDEVKDKTPKKDQDYDKPRAVLLDQLDGKLRIRGWICTDPPRRYFESTEILHSNLAGNSGSLIYKYSSFDSGQSWNFNGIVELEWSKNESQFEIKNLFGRYCGFLTNTTGDLNFRRISKDRFLELCPISDELV